MWLALELFRQVRTRGIGRAARPALAIAILCLALGAYPALAAPGWTLDPAASVLTYQSVKKNTIVETNSIRNITGTITPDGAASVTFDLNSVDTGVDLRNVRMRFLFFETFKFPTATLTAQVDPAAFAELPTKRRMNVKLPYRLSLHGVEKDMEAEIVVTMLTEGMVSVASKTPIAIKVEDFGLLPAIDKLQTAANVTNIVPTASVSFDFVFTADGQPVEPAPAAVVALGPAAVQTVAAELPTGAIGPVETDAGKQAYSDEECFNRFDVLSRTGAIHFRVASAQLDDASRPVLAAVLDAVGKCPRLKVEVAGHTDSDGSDEQNQLLSERRAEAVASFIRDAGIPAAQIGAAGYGEARPIVPNDSSKNKALNRRIEFAATPLVN